MKSSALQALIFDVDGTLADTEAVHLQAFNEAFAQEGMPWQWTEAEYTKLLEVSGGKERMLHYWRQIEPDVKELEPGARAQVVARLHEIKTAAYEARVATGAVKLRPGVLALMEAAQRAGSRAGLALAFHGHRGCLHRPAEKTTPAGLSAGAAGHRQTRRGLHCAGRLAQWASGGSRSRCGRRRHPDAFHSAPRLHGCLGGAARPAGRQPVALGGMADQPRGGGGSAVVEPVCSTSLPLQSCVPQVRCVQHRAADPSYRCHSRNAPP
jgi:Haloacid dehalogenase-like hydrolase